jgi:hypothetical protein
MADTSQSERAAQSSSLANEQSSGAHDGKHVHHGRTPAAWTGVSLAMLGFLVGGFAVVAQNWVLFWIAVGICGIALIVARVMQKLGYGAS